MYASSPAAGEKLGSFRPLPFVLTKRRYYGSSSYRRCILPTSIFGPSVDIFQKFLDLLDVRNGIAGHK